MSDEIEDREAKLLEQALGASKQEHEELSDQFNALDCKTQGAMTTAGIFVAGMLGFIKPHSLTPRLLARSFANRRHRLVGVVRDGRADAWLCGCRK